MKRRAFLTHIASGTLGAGMLAHPLHSMAQTALGAADMHSHWGMAAWNGDGSLNKGAGLRAEMAEAGMLLVAMKVIADFPQLTLRGGVPTGQEYAAPGTLSGYFAAMAQGVIARAQADGLGVVGTRDALEAAIAQRKPAIVLGAEGGDFLEGKLDNLAAARAQGLCHLQLVHYRVNEVGDISTAAPKHNGLSSFGKEVLAACNKQGILVDVAHCSMAGIQHALELSTRPLLYSHGWIAQKETPAYNRSNARAIYIAQAKEIAAKGGVVGIFPVGWRNPEAFAEYLVTAVGLLGANHVGIGTDHSGLPSSALSGYRDFTRLSAALAKGGLKPEEVDAVMGGNYIRVLRRAMEA